MVLAAVLGSIALGRRSFWLDESVSVTIARLNWPSFLHAIHTSEGNMSLYHLILFGWTRFAGDSELAVRSFSVLAGIASVGTVYLLAKRLAGARVAALASLLLAVNPLFVRYAQEARGYELSLFLVILASYLFVRGLERPSWAIWIAYALAAGLSAYAHVFALLVPASHAIALLFRRERRLLPWRKLLTAAGLFTLSLMPLVYLLTASSQSSAVGWVGGSNALGRLFIEIHDRPPLAVAILVLGIASTFFGYRLIVRRLEPRLHALTAWRWEFVLSWLLLPPALVAVVAIVYEPLFLARYFIVCLPAAVLILALVLNRLRESSERLAAVTTAALVLVSLLPVARWYRSGETENWRGATESVVAATHPGDGIIFVAPFVRVPFALYLNEKGLSDRAPAPIDPKGAWETRATVYGEHVPNTTASLEQSALAHPRIWLVLSHTSATSSDYRAVLAALAASGYRQQRFESFTGIDIALYARS